MEAIDEQPPSAGPPRPPAPAAAAKHPPYAEMIITAIRSLNEKNGSSKKAIAKFIDSTYTNLPHSHSSLLTTHLHRLLIKGLVLQFKHSYRLPPLSVPNPKRGRGRPPKLNPPRGQGQQPKRGPGRPPKSIILPGAGRPSVFGKRPPSGPPGFGKRGRGRPPKMSNPIPPPPTNTLLVEQHPVTATRPRGRPRKHITTTAIDQLQNPRELGGEMGVVVPHTRPRGRPPKVAAGLIKMKGGRPVGRPTKTKNLNLTSTGRPVGRPRKSPIPISIPEAAATAVVAQL